MGLHNKFSASYVFNQGFQLMTIKYGETMVLSCTPHWNPNKTCGKCKSQSFTHLALATNANKPCLIILIVHLSMSLSCGWIKEFCWCVIPYVAQKIANSPTHTITKHVPIPLHIPLTFCPTLSGKGHWIRMATSYHYQSKHWHAITTNNLWVKKLYNCEGDAISHYYGFHPLQVIIHGDQNVFVAMFNLRKWT